MSRSGEVSTVAIRPFFERARGEGRAERLLVRDTGLDAEALCRQGARVGWDSFCIVLDNAWALWGDEGLVEIGESIFSAPTPLAALARVVFSPSELYMWFSRPWGLGARFFSCVDASCWETSAGHVSFEATVRDGHGQSPRFFRFLSGMLISLPRLLGCPPASASIEFSGRSALFELRYEGSTSLVAACRRAARHVRTLGVVYDELHAAHELLNRQYQELRRAQASLRASEERFRALIENSSDFVLLSNSEGRVVYLSPSAERITGQSRDQIVGQSHVELAHPDDREAVLAALSELTTRPGEETTLRYRLARTDGAAVWLEGSARNMLFDHRVSAILVNYRDLTERVQLEQQLSEARKLESIGRLAGGIAHDFNNMLTGILGSAQLGLRRLDPGHPAREYFEHVQEYAHRGAALTKQLLAFARKQKLQSKLVNLNDLVGQSRRLLHGVLGDDIEIVTNLTANLGAVRVDPNQFHQVIVNLAINARDAMIEGGVLTLSTDNVYVDELSVRGRAGVTPGAYVSLTVSDSGVGMEPDTLEKLFEPFFTTKEPGQGTGLGLATCHGLIKQIGGHIDVRSKRGEGTTFEILLPKVDVECPPEHSASAPPQPITGSETILLVEDEPSVLSSTAELLRGLGYVVLTAASGADAIETSRNHPAEITAVITDVVMPKMSGPKLVERLQQDRPGIAVLYMSGFATALPESAQVLQKPFELGVLAARLRRLIDRCG